MTQADPTGRLPVLEGLALRRGVLRGLLLGAPDADVPAVDLVLGGEVVAAAEMAPAGGGAFDLSAPVPEEALADGVHTLVFRAREGGGILGRYVLRAGAALDGDVVCALEALEAELAALKRAFMADAADAKLRMAERPLIVEEAVTAVLRELADAGAAVPRRRADK